MPAPTPGVLDLDQSDGGLGKRLSVSITGGHWLTIQVRRENSVSITMIQATQLKDATKLSPESSDLEEDEIIERVDVKTWYQDEGEKIISRMIDDLNAQGHRKLTIRENGEAYITASGTEETVEQIQHFPPRLAWDEFCQVLKEDEITAAVKPEGLLLSW